MNLFNIHVWHTKLTRKSCSLFECTAHFVYLSKYNTESTAMLRILPFQRENVFFVPPYGYVKRIVSKRKGILGESICRNVRTFHVPTLSGSNLIGKKPPRKHFDSDYMAAPSKKNRAIVYFSANVNSSFISAWRAKFIHGKLLVKN